MTRSPVAVFKLIGALGGVASLTAVPACTYDFDQFEATATGGSPNAAGGTATAGGEPPTAGVGAVGAARPGGGAGVPGAGGEATGGSPCASGLKLCGEECVADDNPDTGCGQESCDACTVSNGVPGCSGGSCAVDSCEPGFYDCDGNADTGCEIGLNQFTDDHCGGCGNACTAQGYAGGLVCQNALCACTSPAQCSNHNGSFDCTAGVCGCEGVTCQPGETCSLKVGPDWVCGCNGSDACAAGTTCCHTPAGCRDLQNDNANCGACGWQCPDGKTCTAGACS
jgi:hypothetical protein